MGHFIERRIDVATSPIGKFFGLSEEEQLERHIFFANLQPSWCTCEVPVPEHGEDHTSCVSCGGLVGAHLLDV